MLPSPKVTFNELRNELARSLLNRVIAPPTVQIANLVANDLARAIFRLDKEDVSIRGEQNISRSNLVCLLTILSECIEASGASSKVSLDSYTERQGS